MDTARPTATTASSEQTESATTRAPWLRLLPEDGILSVLLLVIIVFTTEGSIQAVNPPWAPGLSILTATTAVGLLAGYICVQQALLPELLVQTIFVVLGCYFGFVKTADEVLNGNRGALLTHIHVWYNQAVILRETSDDNAVFLLFLAVLSYLLAFISVWLVFRTRRPWLAALANGVVLLINLNSTSDEKAVVFLVIFLLATLLLLVRFTLSDNLQQWRKRGLRFSPDLTWDVMQAGSIFAVAVLLLAYLLPASEANSVLWGAWNSPQGPWQSVVDTWQTLFNGVSGRGANGNGTGIFGGGLQLLGNPNLPSTVELHYRPATSSDDPYQYLMTQSYDTFDGKNTWRTLANTATQRYEKDVTEAPSVPDAPYTFSTVVITLDQPQGTRLFTPGSEPENFSVPSVVSVDRSTGVPVSWTSAQIQAAGTQYVARAYISSATTDQLRAVPYPADAGGASGKSPYPQAILAAYINNPADAPISPRIRALAHEVTDGSTSMYEAASRLEDYLHTYRYNLQNPAPPEGQDAVSWFLFTEKEGFCTYFAASMTLMARSLGMPARIAAGYASGTYDSRSNTYVVKGTQSHVWTQIYFAGYGWINFEPTSSFGGFARATNTGSLPGVTPGATPFGTVQATPPGGNRDRQQDPGASTDTLGGRTSTFLVDVGLSIGSIILLLLTVLALFAIWWRHLYRGLSPVASAFARLTRLGSWAGAPPRRSDTPDEYVEHLGHVVPSHRQALRTLSQLYARERWGGGLPPETVGDLPRLYDQVQRSITQVILRRAQHIPAALAAAISRAARTKRPGRRH